MKNYLQKSDLLAPAFASKDRESISLVKGAKIENASKITLPKQFTPGEDYLIVGKSRELAVLQAEEQSFKSAFGGFHVGLDGAIVQNSFWDPLFRPSCLPLGMFFHPTKGWTDIYFLNVDPHIHGTSKAGIEIADGVSHVMMPNGKRAPLTWWNAHRVLAAHGKQLLSCSEFAAVMDGVEIGKNFGRDPKVTGHAPGLKSRYGAEQATGCMWTWSRDAHPDYNTFYVMGGDWDSSVSGPRRLSNEDPVYGRGYRRGSRPL